MNKAMNEEKAELMMGTAARLTELLHEETRKFADENKIYTPFVVGSLLYLSKRAAGQLKPGYTKGMELAEVVAGNLWELYEEFGGDEDAMRAAIEKESQ